MVIDGASASFSFALDALAVVGQLAAEEWLPSSRDAKVGQRLRCGCASGGGTLQAAGGSLTYGQEQLCRTSSNV